MGRPDDDRQLAVQRGERVGGHDRERLQNEHGLDVGRFERAARVCAVVHRCDGPADRDLDTRSERRLGPVGKRFAFRA